MPASLAPLGNGHGPCEAAIRCGGRGVAALLAVSAKRVTDKESRDESRFTRLLEYFQNDHAPEAIRTTRIAGGLLQTYEGLLTASV